jgi:hypothetical protein
MHLTRRLSSTLGVQVRISVLAMLFVGAGLATGGSSGPSFYKDVRPVLERHCQTCHRPGEIAPMPLVTYQQVRPYARAIRENVLQRKMPPWFADPAVGRFENHPSLTASEIDTITRWADDGAPAGNPSDAPPPHHWPDAWNMARPDTVLTMANPVQIPANGDVEYTYEIVPTRFTRDMWVQSSEIRPSSREHVHHAVVYVRPPQSNWLRDAPVGPPFSASSLRDETLKRDAKWTDSDVLLVYAPGSSPERWRDGMAKMVPAGSDLVFQMHYTTNGHRAEDRTSIGLAFSRVPVSRRVLTLQLTNDHFVIPPGVDNYRVEVHGSLPNNATLLSFFPHMHLRGKRFEYNILNPDGSKETLLRVNYNFFWQLSYKLLYPRELAAGTRLEAVAWFDNSRNNPHNPDPDSAVRWGEQTSDEMMVGFFDVAVPPGIDKWEFFRRAQ